MAQAPRVYKTPGIVLRQRRLGDADKIITLYTAENGKLDAVAKGVRRVRSRLAGHVEPLNHGSYMFAHGRNLDIITQAQTIEAFSPIRDDLDRLSRGLYAAELVDRFTEEREENFPLYRMLLDTLRRLCHDVDIDLTVRFLEMGLLGLLGYQPQLGECVECGRSLDAAGNAWAPGAGGVLCPACRKVGATVRPLSGDALKVLRLLQGGARPDVGPLTAELSNELERHLRDAVHYALDRDVRSAEFVDAVRRPRLRRPPPDAGLAKSPRLY